MEVDDIHEEENIIKEDTEMANEIIKDENGKTEDGFEIVNEIDCKPLNDEPKFNAEILFDNSEPNEQFLTEKRLPKSEHEKELDNACKFYAEAQNRSVLTAVKQAFKIRSVSNAKFPRLELPNNSKNIKAKRWVKRTHVRHDGMKRCNWEREIDEFANDPAILQRNPEHKDLLNLSDDEYNIYFRKLDLEQIPPEDLMEDRKAWPKEIADSRRGWTLEETRYLIGLYHRYTIRWTVITDQYNFKGLQRSLYEIKTRFFFVFDLMCFVRDKRHLMSDYDPELEYAERKRREISFKITPKTQNRIVKLEKEFMEISPADLEPPPRPPPVADAPAAAVQKSIGTGRSSSSVPPSRMPSVPKFASRAYLDQSIDYNKKIEAASDISFLRFFNFQTAGPHLRSQEYKLVSNVNPKKRANIENVIEGLGLLRRTVYNERIAKFYTKLSTNINVISELKAVYSIASAECIALHNEYCEKSNSQIKCEIPPMPQSSEEGKPSICSLAEAPGQNSLNEEELEQRRLNETLEDYRQTFETTKASKVAFVRGEVVNADSKHYGKRGEEVVHHHHHQSKSSSFKPIDISEKARKAQEIANRLAVQNPLAASKDHRAFSPPKSSVPVSRPPRPGKVQTKPKLSNLEQFKEELKAWVYRFFRSFSNMTN
uniref:Myb-like domain-containing protein n=1 Tax=Panagrolaimus superbus TaxID=310955 RepID=A0A914Y768_9BILA